MTALPMRVPLATHPVDPVSWVVTWVADRLQLPQEVVDPDAPVEVFALESAEVLCLTHDVRQHHGVDLAPTLVWQAGTLRRLADHIGAATGRR